MAGESRGSIGREPRDERAEVAAAIAAHADEPGGLLPLLHRLMERLGRVPSDSIPEIAAALHLSRAEVHGVVHYYTDFRTESLGERVVEVCRAEACRARGGDALLARARSRTGCDEGALRSRDDRFSVLAVDCLGLCATAPAARIDGRPHGRLTPERLDRLIDEAPTRTAGVPRTTRTAAPPELRLFLSMDSAVRAVGAEAVATALVAASTERGIALELVHTSARGAFVLEPLVEVETSDGRIGFGPVTPDQAASVLDACLTAAATDRDVAPGTSTHPLALGPIESHAFFARQRRSLFVRAGRTRPLVYEEFRDHGGLAGVRAALASQPTEIRRAVLESGLRGRGGAAFPAGIKWQTVADARGGQKYVVCNADEGDSGTFADRMLLEGDPFLLIEGMAIAAIAVGATAGFVYVRSEYPDAVETLRAAIDRARREGLLGRSVLGSRYAFDLEVRVGAGSYVCGEETAMLESLEGRRGIVRAKPPLPAVAGLFGRPTLIQNVLTFAAVPAILAEGAEAYRALGVGRSTGTMPFQLAGNVRNGGLVELPFGVTLRELVFGFGGGAASGRPVKAIQVGGPLGRYVPEAKWDEPMDYERYAGFGAVLGHGGIVVHDDTADLAALARHAMAFCARESCGKCTPCRIGSTRGVEILERLRKAGSAQEKTREVALLRDLCTTMIDASLCAMGGMTPLPVLSALDEYPGDFGLPDER